MHIYIYLILYIHMDIHKHFLYLIVEGKQIFCP